MPGSLIVGNRDSRTNASKTPFYQGVKIRGAPYLLPDPLFLCSLVPVGKLTRHLFSSNKSVWTRMLASKFRFQFVFIQSIMIFFFKKYGEKTGPSPSLPGPKNLRNCGPGGPLGFLDYFYRWYPSNGILPLATYFSADRRQWPAPNQAWQRLWPSGLPIFDDLTTSAMSRNSDVRLQALPIITALPEIAFGRPIRIPVSPMTHFLAWQMHLRISTRACVRLSVGPSIHNQFFFVNEFH